MATPTMLDPTTYEVDFGEGYTPATVGPQQPDEGPFKVRMGEIVLQQDGGKVFFGVPWKVIEDPKNLGCIGRNRSDRVYLPYKGQDEKKRNTSMEFLTRWLASVLGIEKATALTGKINAAKIVKAMSGKEAPIHYSPYIEGTKSHENSNTVWCQPDEYQKLVSGELNWNRKVVETSGPGYARSAATLGAAADADDDLDAPLGGAETAKTGGAATGGAAAASADLDDLI